MFGKASSLNKSSTNVLFQAWHLPTGRATFSWKEQWSKERFLWFFVRIDLYFSPVPPGWFKRKLRKAKLRKSTSSRRPNGGWARQLLIIISCLLPCPFCPAVVVVPYYLSRHQDAADFCNWYFCSPSILMFYDSLVYFTFYFYKSWMPVCLLTHHHISQLNMNIWVGFISPQVSTEQTHMKQAHWGRMEIKPAIKTVP